jgi:hypothetical protein
MSSSLQIKITRISTKVNILVIIYWLQSVCKNLLTKQTGFSVIVKFAQEYLSHYRTLKTCKKSMTVVLYLFKK